MQKTIAVAVAAYGISAESLGRIKRVAAAGYDVYVYDNSPHQRALFDLCAGNPALHYFCCGQNAGLGVAIATLCSHAANDGYYGLIFFDQDTGFTEQTLDFVSAYASSNVAAHSQHAAVVFNAVKPIVTSELEAPPAKDVLVAINSGSLYLLANVIAMGGHDISYFVDGVDYKFCLDSARKGFKIGLFEHTPGFDHVTEQDDETYVVLGRKIRMRPYPWRRIRDTCQSNVRLMISGVKACNPRFVATVLRLFFFYGAMQLYVRFAKKR